MLIIQRQAANPATKADKNPAIKTPPVIPPEIEGSSIKSSNLRKEPPSMGTKTIKNENLAALSLSIPSSNAVEMVAPDLDKPGKMAIVWAKPMRSALDKVTFPSFLGAKWERVKSRAVIKSMKPINKIFPPKKE